MTVGELKNILSGFNDDAEVMYSFPSHDYWRNTLASEISDVTRGKVEWSDYHSNWRLLDPEDKVKKPKTVVVLT